MDFSYSMSGDWLYETSPLSSQGHIHLDVARFMFLKVIDAIPKTLYALRVRTKPIINNVEQRNGIAIIRIEGTG